MKNRNIRTVLYVLSSVVIIGGVFALGAYMGYARRPAIEKIASISHKEPQVETTADFDTFWRVWNLLNEKSLYAKKFSDQDRVWGATQGLADSLGDPYTVFFSPEENKLFNDEIHGSFGGIGAEIGIKDKVLTIISPLKDTPASKAGIKAGDKIIRIDKATTNEMTTDKAISLIRGAKGTPVSLVVLRPGEKNTREFTIIRDDIFIPTIETETKPGKIFVIKFYSFSENSAELFRTALNDFRELESDKLIIDMRGNPGGYLDSSIQIASWFIDAGKVIVTEDFGEKRKPQVFRSYGPRLFNENLKLVVLIDGGSASASEILAGALQEHNIATLVGEKTFGKGSVQELIPVTDTTSLKVTVARWLTPNGKSLSTEGLTPDVKVSITAKDVEQKRDTQMEKALEIVRGQN
ncbi:MAG: S41 family peptidase [Candidatus Paceibacterota bacterium]